MTHWYGLSNYSDFPINIRHVIAHKQWSLLRPHEGARDFFTKVMHISSIENETC